MIKTVKKIEIIKTIETMKIELTQAEAIEIFNSFSDKKRLKIFKRALKSVMGKKKFKHFEDKKLLIDVFVSTLSNNEYTYEKEIIRILSKKLKTKVEKKDYFPTLLTNIKGMKSNDGNGYTYKIKKTQPTNTVTFVSSLLK